MQPIQKPFEYESKMYTLKINGKKKLEEEKIDLRLCPFKEKFMLAVQWTFVSVLKINFDIKLKTFFRNQRTLFNNSVDEISTKNGYEKCKIK